MTVLLEKAGWEGGGGREGGRERGREGGWEGGRERGKPPNLQVSEEEDRGDYMSE